ncbi:hypothetical protein [Micromonospora sp. SH-82]|uniref:hypothetical protein n=1 Tax=Micromonospora sp. SH-82 TaxID=3132938 RepID=UPI003EBCE857
MLSTMQRGAVNNLLGIAVLVYLGSVVVSALADARRRVERDLAILVAMPAHVNGVNESGRSAGDRRAAASRRVTVS